MSEGLELPASEEPLASILIPAFHVPTFGACLRSLARHLPDDVPCEVVALLNGPSDALREAAAGVAGLREVDSPANLGFPAGLNAVRAHARGRLLVLFQDDAEIEPGWLEALVAAAEAHPEAGAVGGMVLDHAGERVQSTGLLLWSDASHWALDRGRTPQEGAARGLHAVDYSSSSSLAVRAETWDAVGGADEDFFPAGHVDTDLAMRIRRHGQVVLNEPAARTRHVQSASRSTRYKRFTAVRNWQLFRERWGAELAETQEPPGQLDPEAVDRALARAESRWRAVRETWRGAGVPASAARPECEGPGTEEQLRLALRASQRHLDLKLAYEAELEAALDWFEPAVADLRAEVDRLSEPDRPAGALAAVRRRLAARVRR